MKYKMISCVGGGETSQTLDASYYKGVGSRNGKEREVLAVEPTYMSDRKGHNGITEDGTATTLTAQEKERPLIITKEMIDATARNPILQILQEAYGAETTLKWCLAIVERVQQTNILQQGVHEERVSGKTKNRDELDGNTPPSPIVVAEWLLRNMREQSERGRTSQGWESTEQRPDELAEIVSQLPHQSTQAAKALLDMWSEGKGLWLLQQALHQIQKIRESVMGERTGGGVAMKSVVRRLTPLE